MAIVEIDKKGNDTNVLSGLIVVDFAVKITDLMTIARTKGAYLVSY